MDTETNQKLAAIKALCRVAGIDFIAYLGEVEFTLRNRLRNLFTPNAEWFEAGKSLNRYWEYLEKVTSYEWKQEDVNDWYKLVRNPSDTREQIPPALRYQVLLRDKSTCQKCGQKAPDVEVDVDHKLPWSWGGPTTMENLHILCKKCNLGKSNLYVEGSE